MGTGVSANIGITFSIGKFIGNPWDIESSFLQGNSYGLSSGFALGSGASLNTSFAPTDISNFGAGGFMIIGGQIGWGVEFSPATIINLELTLQKHQKLHRFFN